MKKLKKKKRRTYKNKLKQNLKLSEMVINFAGDYIDLGETLESKQSYLNGACIAWNISLLPEGERKDAIDFFIEQYKTSNPGIDDTENVRKDIETLIEEKLQLYPNERRGIVNAKIVEDANGKRHVIVASTRNN
jgi:hypothetical protein